jgi:hypothetical protein
MSLLVIEAQPEYLPVIKTMLLDRGLTVWSFDDDPPCGIATPEVLLITFDEHADRADKPDILQAVISGYPAIRVRPLIAGAEGVPASRERRSEHSYGCLCDPEGRDPGTIG